MTDLGMPALWIHFRYTLFGLLYFVRLDSSSVDIKSIGYIAFYFPAFLKMTRGKSILLATTVAHVGITTVFLVAERNRDYKLARFMRDNFMVSPHGVLREGKVHTLITSIFSHKDPMHLLFNTMGMYSFGMSTLAFLGPARFIALYLGGGLISSISFVAWPFVIPKSWPAYNTYNGSNPGLGASGAINALVMWSVLKEPLSKFLLFGVLPLPAFVCGLGFIAYDTYGLYDGSGNIGNASHLSGAAFGALYFMFTRRLPTYSFRKL